MNKMNIKINLRAWDKKAKRFLSNSETLKILLAESEGVLSEKDMERYDIEQHIGIPDVNYNDLYAGDIVLYHDFTNFYSSDILGVISFADGSWGIYNENRPFNPFVPFPFSEVMCFTSKKLKKLGNIHQNPEMIEVKNESV